VAGIAKTIRSRGRQSLRAARRVTGGARSFGPRTTAEWAWSRRPGDHGSGATAENTSFTWVQASERSTTHVVVHNYWSDAYGIERPELQASLITTDGTVLDQWTFTLPPDGTEVIDVRTRCAAAAIALPFEGQLLLRLAHDDVVAGRPVQHYADYLRDDGESSGVHGQYGFIQLPLAQGVGTMRVESGSGRRTAVVLHNAYAGPGSPTSMEVPVDVFAHDGRRRSVRLDPLAAGASRLVWLDECFDGLDAFLDDRPGHVRVELGCPSSRVFTYVALPPDGRPVVNHGTVDRLLQQDPGVPVSWTESWPVLSMLVWCDGDRDTVVALPNLWGPARADYPVRIDVFDEAGQRVATERLTVPAGGLTERSMAELLRDAGVGLPFTGNAEVRLRAPAGVEELPAVFDGLVAIRAAGTLVGEVQVGSEFYNAAMPPECRQPDIRRTRIFGRVVVGADRRTWIHLAHPVADDGEHAASATLLTLLDGSGEHRSTREVALPPHGSLLSTVEDLFPEAAELLGPSGTGVLRVRDTTARLYGFAALEVDGARTIAIDHLTGG